MKFAHRCEENAKEIALNLPTLRRIAQDISRRRCAATGRSVSSCSSRFACASCEGSISGWIAVHLLAQNDSVDIVAHNNRYWINDMPDVCVAVFVSHSKRSHFLSISETLYTSNNNVITRINAVFYTYTLQPKHLLLC